MGWARNRKPSSGTAMGAAGMAMGAIALIVALGGVAIGQSGLEQSKSPAYKCVKTAFGYQASGGNGAEDDVFGKGLSTNSLRDYKVDECGRRIADIVVKGLVGTSICAQAPGSPGYAQGNCAGAPPPKAQPNGWADFIKWTQLIASATNAAMPKNVVTAKAIKPAAVTAKAIAPSAVTTPAIKPKTITGNLIIDRALHEQLLANDAITARVLASKAVTAPAIANGAVSTAQIAGNAITAPLLAPSSVTAPKIAPMAVGTAAFSPAVVRTSTVAQTVNQSPAPNYTVVWDDAAFAAGGFTGTGTTGAIAPVDGTYEVTAKVSWEPDVTAAMFNRTLELKHTLASGPGTVVFGSSTIPGSNDANGTPQQLTATVALEAGESVFVNANHGVGGLGGPLDILAGGSFSMKLAG